MPTSMPTAHAGLLFADLMKKVGQTWVLSSLLMWIGVARWRTTPGEGLDTVSAVLQVLACLCDFASTLRPGGGSFTTGIKLIRRAPSLDIAVKTLTTKVTAYGAATALATISASLAAVAQTQISRVRHHGLSPRTLIALAVPGFAAASLTRASLEWTKEVAFDAQHHAAPIVRAVMVVRASALASHPAEALVLAMQTAPLAGQLAVYFAYGEAADPLAPVVSAGLAVVLVAYHLASKPTQLGRAPLCLFAAAACTLAPQAFDAIAFDTNPKSIHFLVTLLNCLLALGFLVVGATPFCLALLLTIHTTFHLHDLPLGPETTSPAS